MKQIEEILLASKRLEQECDPKPQMPAQGVAPADVQLKLPRAIVFGDEKAGKSSTIERIAQNDIFPRDVNVCTRMPTVLKLRPNKDYPTEQPMFILTIPECKTKDGVVYNKDAVCANFQTRDVEQIRNRIKAQMDAISVSGKGCESDQEITVELHSEDVLHIDLVDLPGLRSVSEKNDQQLVDALEQCTKKYISSKETGVILCVLSAQNPQIQTCASLRMLMNLNTQNPLLTYSCVAVLTNTDLSADKEWEDMEPPVSGPCHRVEEWLCQFDIDGRQGDPTADQLRSIFKAGFVALVNRSQIKRSVMHHTLKQAQEHEIRWFVENSGMTRFGALPPMREGEQPHPPAEPGQLLPSLNQLGSLKLGLPALVGKIDRMIRRFMSKDFIPGEIKKQESEAEKKRKELLSLGVKPIVAQICVEDKTADEIEVVKSKKEKGKGSAASVIDPKSASFRYRYVSETGAYTQLTDDYKGALEKGAARSVFMFQPEPIDSNYEVEVSPPVSAVQPPVAGAPAVEPSPSRHRLVPATGKHERLTHEDVFKSATAKVNTFLQKHIETLDFTSMVPKAAFEKFNTAKLRIQRAAAKLELMQILVDSISKEDEHKQGSAIAIGVKCGVLDGIRKQFEDDKEGDIQLARFDQMKELFVSEARKDMDENVAVFQQDAITKMSTMLTFASGCNNLDAVHGTAANLHTMICGMLVESAIQSLLCPLLVPGSFEVGPESPFLKRANSILNQDVERWQRNEKVEIFVESRAHLAKRTMLEKTLNGICDVIKEWEGMKIPEGDVPLLEIDIAVAVEGKSK